MELVMFDDKYRQAFIDFNTEWIVSNFGSLEENDFKMFNHLDDEIKGGAMIFFAVEDDVPLACCMSRKLEDETWEICKLGSNKDVPHKGAGSMVFKAAMDWAIKKRANRILIISNSRLKPALHIYKKFGFREVLLDNYEYARGDIAFEYMIDLDGTLTGTQRKNEA